MRRTRDENRGPAYADWVAERAVEVSEEQGLQAEAQAATEAADPVKAFQKASDAEAQAVLEIIRTGYIPHSILPGVERMNGRMIANEAAAIRNFKYFAESTASFQYWMGRPLLDAAERSDLSPIAPNYLALHNLMLQYGAYPEPPAQEVAPALVEEQPTLTRSEQAIHDHDAYVNAVVGTDELGRQYTEAMLDELPSKQALHLRRLFESGHRGSNLLTLRREILDTKQIQDAERARIAAEEMGGN
jgi:hypothetical protein